MDEEAFTRLLAAQAFPGEPQWVLPAYHGQSIINMMGSLLAHFGVSFGTRLKNHNSLEQRLAGKRKVLFFFLDGLGWRNLEHAAHRYPVIGDVFSPAWRYPLTTVSPSTTSTATASYLTALPPIKHGILGFLMYFPEYGRVFNMLGFRTPDALREDLLSFGFRPERFLTVPTVLDRLDAAGVMVGAYNYAAYAGSGLSRLLYTGHLPYAYVALGDMLAHVSAQLSMACPQFHILYWSTLDTIAHTYGAGSDAYARELLMLATTIRDQLMPQLEGETALVICADHGHIDGDDNQAINLAQIPGLIETFRVLPSGEGRATHLFIKDGLRDKAQSLLDAQGEMLVLTQEDFLDLHTLGDDSPTDEVLARIGDLIVVPYGTRRTLYPYEIRPHTAMVGRHGGFSPEEMIVPLLVF